ncbi:MAG: hypothetical protein N2323_01580, partial [candidate division WOR-3 bacterium]|nr:hypothetical protein [candidate division WOR-3 bacterium]
FIPNNYTIKIKFNENLSSEIDLTKFFILSEKETLKIKNIFVENEFLTIITEKQRPIDYLLFGGVKDLKNNFSSWKIKFKGNPNPDTVKPFIQNISINQKEIRINFSEPMKDTNLYYFLFPSTAIETIWNKDGKSLTFLFKEKPKEFCSFLILPTLKDLGENNLVEGKEAFEIFDTATKFINLTGKVFLKESLVNNSIIIFKKKDIFSFALTKKGVFKTKLKEGKYQIISLLDSDLDFLPEFYDITEKTIEKDTTISIFLLPVKEKKRIDEYLK